VGVYGDVPEVPGAADVTAQEFAVGEDRPTDAGAERQQDDVARAAGGAEPRLADQGGVGVVEDGDGCWGCEERRPVNTLDCGHAALHPGDAPLVARGQAGGAEADAVGTA